MPPTRIKAAQFDDRMTLVEHLDELRNRIIVCGIVLALACVGCFVFNDAILDLANNPLPNSSQQLITLSPTEPFLTTLTLVLYSAVIVTMPVLLYQLYAFIVPAMSPQERKVVIPLLLMVPVLFVLGVIFAYFVVVPAAVKFLLNFNDDQFNIQIRAREYYSFFSLSLLSVGVLFQIPVGILAITRLGVVTPETLAKNRRYAILIIAVLAMLLPGTDPITMLISMIPLVLLFEFSLILARWFGNASFDEDEPEDDSGGDERDPPDDDPEPDPPAEDPSDSDPDPDDPDSYLEPGEPEDDDGAGDPDDDPDEDVSAAAATAEPDDETS